MMEWSAGIAGIAGDGRSAVRVLPYGLVAALLLATPAVGQVEDEQTEDYERQDRQYLERLRQLEEQEEEESDEPAATDREAFLAKAEELVRDRHYNTRSTDHYRVQTDDIRLLIDETGDLLESFHAFFEEFWTGRVELADEEETSRVFLFRSFYKYNQLLQGDFRRASIRPKGHYLRAFDVIATHSAADLPQQLPDALVHEAAHQLVERRLYPGGLPSLWVSEGLASYFGYTYRSKDGTFVPGVVGGKSIRLIRDTPPGQSKEGIDRLRRFRREAGELGAGNFVDDLISIRDPGQFYGADVDLNYAGSWLLVHFLLHGDDGRYRAAFVRYLSLDAQGAGPDVLYQTLEVDPQELQAGFFAHLRRIKTR